MKNLIVEHKSGNCHSRQVGNSSIHPVDIDFFTVKKTSLHVVLAVLSVRMSN